nr:sulfurtransferase complex subunit TusB [Providencia alcalifaciens]
MLRLVTNEDAILLFQDGVLAGISRSKYLLELQNSGAQIYALDADIYARGLQNQIADGVSIISYQGFVKLTEAHKQHFAL